MGCSRNPPTLSKEQFEKAYARGGWAEVFKQDPAFGKRSGLITKLHVALLLRTLLLSEKMEKGNAKDNAYICERV